MTADKRKWVPEIVYEEYDGLSEGIPFIQVPEGKEIPDVIFMFGSTETGEFEPDQEGNPQPIMELELYQYANMKYLKDGLTPELYDQVRTCLGLQPLEEATQKGKNVSENILSKSVQNNSK